MVRLIEFQCQTLPWTIRRGLQVVVLVPPFLDTIAYKSYRKTAQAKSVQMVETEAKGHGQRIH